MEKMKLRTREQKLCLGKKEHRNRKNAFREQGNTRKILLGTRGHEENKAGTRGKKLCLGNKEHRNRKHAFKGTTEALIIGLQSRRPKK